MSKAQLFIGWLQVNNLQLMTRYQETKSLKPNKGEDFNFVTDGIWTLWLESFDTPIGVSSEVVTIVDVDGRKMPQSTLKGNALLNHALADFIACLINCERMAVHYGREVTKIKGVTQPKWNPSESANIVEGLVELLKEANQ